VGDISLGCEYLRSGWRQVCFKALRESTYVLLVQNVTSIFGSQSVSLLSATRSHNGRVFNDDDILFIIRYDA
jgi:hypothetical protein